MIKTYVEVRVPFRAYHQWKQAPEKRKYLSHPHPHNFEVRVEIEVFHEDREVEFHDLQDLIYSLVKDFKTINSCEHLATHLLTRLQIKFPGRDIQVEVWEDESCGGKVKYLRDY